MEIYNQRNYSTLIDWNTKRDCAVIGAFHIYEGCGYEKKSQKLCQSDEFGNVRVNSPKVLRPKERKIMRKALQYELFAKGYTFIKLYGKLDIQMANSAGFAYFVINIDKKETFERDLVKLGIKYRQDAVLFLPQGTLDPGSKIYGYFIGTNRCCNNPISFGQKVHYSKKYLDTITINGIDLHLIAAIFSPYEDVEFPEFVQPSFASMMQAMVEPALAIRKYEKSLPKNWKSHLRSIDV